MAKKLLSLAYILDVNTRRINVDAGKEETTVEAILEELAQEIHSSVGVRMHRLGVVVWEVKLWMAAGGQANGAWRVIVNNVTGHTCTVHVSLFYFKISRKYFLHASTFPFSFIYVCVCVCVCVDNVGLQLVGFNNIFSLLVIYHLHLKDY